MTTDADWLRARPEIVSLIAEAIEDALKLHKHEREVSREEATEVGARALPLIRADIRDDVVRELAGDVPHSALCASRDGTTSPCDCAALEIGAAAHIAGYERAREEAAKVADEHEDDARTIIASAAAEEIAIAIRSLKP